MKKKNEKGKIYPIRRWTFDIFEVNVQKASNQAETFWNKTIEIFLKPTKFNEEQENVIKKDLKIMKIVSVAVLGFTNISYSLLMILKMSFPSNLGIGITFCLVNLDFIDITLLVFVSVITIFLLLGTILEKCTAMAHLTKSFTSFSNLSPGAHHFKSRFCL